jgi:hypothetical protein
MAILLSAVEVVANLPITIDSSPAVQLTPTATELLAVAFAL